MKSVTEWISMQDTLVPEQRLQYDTGGRLIKREVFYYGALFFTEFFSYSDKDRTITVYNERITNKNRRQLSYVLKYDTFHNVISYINSDRDNHMDGLDSIRYIYRYNKEHQVTFKIQKMYYGTDYQDSLTHKYRYDQSGDLVTHIIASGTKTICTITNEYKGNGHKVKKSTVDENGKFLDSTLYYYNNLYQLALVRKYFKYDPLSSFAQDEIIMLEYDDKGLVKAKHNPPDKGANYIAYTWELY